MNTSTVAGARPPRGLDTTVRTGAVHWLHSLGWMLRFDLARARQWAPIMVIIQIIMGAGMAIVYGFFYPHVTPAAGVYIATGTPALALIPLGFFTIPNALSQQKLQGTLDFIWSLPVPRSAQAASTFILYTVLALPGMVLTLVVAAVRYGVHLDMSAEIVPGAVLCSLMAISVGFGMALAIPNPLITNLIANALVFVVLLFSPIVYPLAYLPGWLSAIDRVLPFYNMGVVIRAGLTNGLVSGLTPAFLIVLAWTAAGVAMTGLVLGRRG